MTTIVPFIPSNIMAPSFKARLDGNDYDIRVTWNISAQRYYINVYDGAGNWIITTALVSSPPARAATSAVYDPFLNSVTVEMLPYNMWGTPYADLATKPGTMIDYTLEGFQPNTYNGKFRCIHLETLKFALPMPTDPGPLLIIGRVSRLLNMVEPIFTTSSLIYRHGSFEISP